MFSVNFENPVKLNDKFELTTVDEMNNKNNASPVISKVMTESSPEMKPSPYKSSENKVPSKGLKLSKKKKQDADDY